MARGQAGAQRLPQVGHVVLVHLQVGVARDAELRKGLHRAARQQFAQVRTDHAGQQHKPLLARRHQPVGQPGHARQRPRHLHDDDGTAGRMYIVTRQAQDEVQALVGHQREGVGRVQGHGHQQRAHLGLEEAGHPAPLAVIALGVVEDANPLFGQGRHHFIVEQPVLLADEGVSLRREVGELLPGLALRALANQFQPVRKAHLEELIQVGRNDGDVAQALQQRHIGALCLGQHTAVEGQQGSFAIDHVGARWAALPDGGVGSQVLTARMIALACDGFVTCVSLRGAAAPPMVRPTQDVMSTGGLS